MFSNAFEYITNMYYETIGYGNGMCTQRMNKYEWNEWVGTTRMSQEKERHNIHIYLYIIHENTQVPWRTNQSKYKTEDQKNRGKQEKKRKEEERKRSKHYAPSPPYLHSSVRLSTLKQQVLIRSSSWYTTIHRRRKKKKLRSWQFILICLRVRGLN